MSMAISGSFKVDGVSCLQVMQMKILIIEDEALLADSLRTLLELRGFDVEVVSDGESGAEYAEMEYTICSFSTS